MSNHRSDKWAEVIPRIIKLVVYPVGHFVVSETSNADFGATVSGAEGLGNATFISTTGSFKLLAQHLLERTHSRDRGECATRCLQGNLRMSIFLLQCGYQENTE